MTQSSERILAVWTGVAAVLLGLTSGTHLVLTELRQPSTATLNSIAAAAPAPISQFAIERPVATPARKKDSLMTTIEPLSISPASSAQTEMEIVPKVEEMERQLPKQAIAKAANVTPPVSSTVQAATDAGDGLLLDIDADILAMASMPTAELAPTTATNSRIDDIVAGHARQAHDATAREIGGSLNAGLGGLLN